MMNRSTIAVAALCAILCGCQTTDYTPLENYYDHVPTTVVVLPVANESTDVEAARFFLATIARPLARRGYYVLPIESTLEIFEREGLYDAGLAWEVEPRLLYEYLGADAALYVTVLQWDTNYAIFASNVTVTMRYLLVDCHTGEELWERTGSYTKSSGGTVGGGGLAGLIAGLTIAAIDAATTAALTDYVPLASQANQAAFAALPPGEYSSDYAPLRKRIARWREKNPKQEHESDDENSKEGDRSANDGEKPEPPAQDPPSQS